MKNHKGAVATLLTLGLVLVGTLITLGTSLFVSNKKTNLASNSMAAVACTGNENYFCYGTKCMEGKAKSFGSYCGNGEVAQSKCKGGSGCGGTAPAAQQPATLPDCEMTVSFASQDCAYGIDTAGCKSGTAKCKSKPAAAQPADDGENYPSDDSCWLVKCINGKAKKMTPAYTTSLKKYNMPLSSCPDSSPYSGGGWTVIGSDNADAKAKTFNCENGNEEITLAPTKVPTKAPTLTLTPPPSLKCDYMSGNTGATCPNGTKFSYHRDSSCEGSGINDKPCYGTVSGKCNLYTWDQIWQSKCNSVPLATLTPTPKGNNSSISCEKMTCPSGKTGKYFKNTINEQIKFYETETDCLSNKNFSPYEPDMINDKNVCVPIILPLTASTQCTNQECPSPNEGIWYSYKCTGTPQTISSVTSCPNYNFYGGKDCKSIRADLNQGNIKQNYCGANYTSSFAKRTVTISYTVNQTGAININPNNPEITLHIRNDQGLGLFSVPFKIGETSFPASGSKPINTGTNLIKSFMTYQGHIIPCGSVRVEDKKANIICSIK